MRLPVHLSSIPQSVTATRMLCSSLLHEVGRLGKGEVREEGSKLSHVHWMQLKIEVQPRVAFCIQDTGANRKMTPSTIAGQLSFYSAFFSTCESLQPIMGTSI